MRSDGGQKKPAKKKNPKGKHAGRKSGWEPRLKLKALPTGLYNVIENRLLLKKTKDKEKTKERLVQKPK